MRWILGFLAALVVLAVSAALLAPVVVDLESRKPAIAALVTAATGRSFAIDGPIEFRILPAPMMAASNVRLGNLAGAPDPDMVTVGSVEARLSLSALLRGRLAVDSLELRKALVVLEATADGAGNWRFTPGDPGLFEGPDAWRRLTFGMPLEIARIAVDDSTIEWRRADGTIEHFVDARLLLKSEMPSGPYAVDGRMRVRGQDIAWTVSTTRMLPDRPTPVSLGVTLGADAARLRFAGTLQSGAATSVEGKLGLSSANLAQAMSLFGIVAPPPFAAAAALEAKLALDHEHFGLDGLTANIGAIATTGRVEAVFGAPSKVDVALAISQVDLDALRAAWGTPPSTEATPPPAMTAEQPANAAPFDLPGGVEAKLDLAIGAVALGGGVIQQVRINGGIAGGIVTINKAGALLPGGSDASVTGQVRQTALGPRFDGTLDLVSDNLRGLLGWAGVEPGDVPADRLMKLQLTTRIGATGEVVQFGGVDMRVDGSRVTGAAAVALRARPSFSVDAILDQINIDAYVPSEDGGTAPGLQMPDTRRLAGFDTNFRLRVGQAIWRGASYGGIDADLALLGGTLNVNRIEIEDMAGARLNGGGLVRGLADQPSIDLTLIVDAADPAGVLKLAGLHPPAGEALGAGHLDLSLAGASESQNLRFQASLGEAKIEVTGMVTDLLSAPFVDVVLDGSVPSLRKLGLAAGIDTGIDDARDDPVTIEGTLAGGTDEAESTLGLDIAGGRVDVRGKTAIAAGGSSGTFAITARADNGPSFLEGLGLHAPADPTAPPVSFALDTTIGWDGGAYTLNGLKANLGPADLVLDARLSRQDRPRLEATLSAGEIDVEMLPRLRAPVATGETGWSTEPLPIGWLRQLDGTVNLAARKITWNGNVIEQVRGKAEFTGGLLTLSDASAMVWGGSLGLDGHAKAGDDGLDGGLDLRLANADLTTARLDEILLLNGRFDTHLMLSAHGASVASLAATLAGQAGMTARDGAILGLDLGKAGSENTRAVRPTELVVAIGRDLAAGATPYRGIEATWDIADGKATQRTFKADIDKVSADISAPFDIGTWTIDLRGTFGFPDRRDAPPVQYALTGPLYGPTQHIDGAAFTAWATQHIGSQRGGARGAPRTGASGGALKPSASAN